MKIKNFLFVIYIIIGSFQFTLAQENNSSSISKDLLLTINNKAYYINDFPHEYQTLSEQEQKNFLSEYLYYDLFLNAFQTEYKKYKSEIDTALKQKTEELNKKGIVPPKLQKILFDKKVIVNTIAYCHILNQTKNIDSQLKDFYEKNKKGYSFPQRVDVSHIVIQDLNQSQTLLKQLQKNNIQLFAKLAKEYSLDSLTKHNGGYLGEISEATVEKDFFDNVWSAKEHSVIQKPLKHNDYYHIVYVFKKYKAEQKTFDQEKESIKEYLLKKDIKKWKDEQITKLKKESDIKFYNITFP